MLMFCEYLILTNSCTGNDAVQVIMMQALHTLQTCFKDTHREKPPSNKTQKLRTSIYMGIWVVGILNQLFIKVSYTKIKFSKNIVVKLLSL